MSHDLIQELRDAHARLLKLESELEALKSQLGPYRKRIAVARVDVDAIVMELASGQSSLPLFRTEPPLPHGNAPFLGAGKILVPSNEQPAPQQLTAAVDGDHREPQRNGVPDAATQPPLAAATLRHRLKEDARLSPPDSQPVRRRRGKRGELSA